MTRLLLLVPIINAQIFEQAVNLPHFVKKQYENYFNYSSSYESYGHDLKLSIPEITIFELSKEINCDGNTCCEELQKTMGRYRALLKDASGPIRRAGLITSVFSRQPSDGVISQCQRIERAEEKHSFGGKYCQLDLDVSGLRVDL